MAAMWTYGTRRESFPTYVADIRGAASVAHIYGQNLVAAESLTSAVQPWAYAPRQLKPIVDLEFALGVNRIVVHTSAHQPVEKPPGLSLFIFGQFFNRLENWADYAGPWVTYMARSSSADLKVPSAFRLCTHSRCTEPGMVPPRAARNVSIRHRESFR